MDNCKDVKYVKWQLFWATITIFTIVIGYLFNCISNAEGKVDSTKVDMIEIRTQLSQIQTDILWIKQSLTN